MAVDIRSATLQDVPFLLRLEENFPSSRRFDKTAITRSVNSPHQDVYIIADLGNDLGSITIWRYEKTWRVYTIAIAPEYRGHDYGRVLMRYVINKAKENGIPRIVLEADAKESHLLQWYETFGFVQTGKLKDYYGPKEHGVKMTLVLKEEASAPRYFTDVLVVDRAYPGLEELDEVEVITAETFLNDERYITAKELRIFNLCSSYDYQSIGYYVSLVSSARGLRATPNVATIEDFFKETIATSIGEEIDELIEQTFKHRRDKNFKLTTVFGRTNPKQYTKLGRALNRLFDAPMLEFTFSKNRRWHLINVRPLFMKDMEVNVSLVRMLGMYLENKRFNISGIKQYKYDLAILVDMKEEAPPSGKTALARLVKAAEKLGFYAEFITKEDYHRIPQFDALFIRVTTNVNDYTYQFSRYAYAEGLVVIDDPWSILKCANKIYFHETARSENIPTPKTMVLSNKTPLADIVSQIPFPIILKRPDSASSKGVFKVNDLNELKSKLKELFHTSELLIAQECVISPFDWRIGILGGKPIYACKYYMAKNHWQIYNWHAEGGRITVGGVETFLVEDAPKDVVDYAVKAASVMGDGFYGVDVKVKDGRPLVIEVNDCPSIDYGWEDKLLGDKLYLMVCEYFLTKIEAARQKKQPR
jgi:glutathione synthase/RimK-type ligase-like ATP-grasp enzyme/ribosomal protein S18 acetylase RimI-like enzyme